MALPAEKPAEDLVEEPEIQPRLARPPRPIVSPPAGEGGVFSVPVIDPPVVSIKKERSLLRELKGLKEGFAPGMSLSEDEGSSRSHRHTRSEYRREPPGGFSGMIIAAISGTEPRTWKESRCLSKILGVRPTVDVSGVPKTADGHPKIKGSEAPGKSSGKHITSERRLGRSQTWRAVLRGSVRKYR
jgi:hypothetical protein